MACGDSLRHMLRTKDGRTPSDPCGAFCWEGDEYEWVETVSAIVRRVEAEYGNLKRVKPELAEEHATSVKQFLIDAQALPGWAEVFLVGGFESEIRKSIESIIGIGQQGICILEGLSQAVATAGGRPLVPVGTGKVPGAGPGKSLIDQAGSWVFLVGAAYALWWLSQRSGGAKAVES